MKIVELLNLANEGYPDGILAAFYDEDTINSIEGSAAPIAEFIVLELLSTFRSDADDEVQASEAIRALNVAKGDLESVINALEEGFKAHGIAATESPGSNGSPVVRPGEWRKHEISVLGSRCQN